MNFENGAKIESVILQNLALEQSMYQQSCSSGSTPLADEVVVRAFLSFLGGIFSCGVELSAFSGVVRNVGLGTLELCVLAGDAEQSGGRRRDAEGERGQAGALFFSLSLCDSDISLKFLFREFMSIIKKLIFQRQYTKAHSTLGAGLTTTPLSTASASSHSESPRIFGGRVTVGTRV